MEYWSIGVLEYWSDGAMQGYKDVRMQLTVMLNAVKHLKAEILHCAQNDA